MHRLRIYLSGREGPRKPPPQPQNSSSRELRISPGQLMVMMLPVTHQGTLLDIRGRWGGGGNAIKVSIISISWPLAGHHQHQLARRPGHNGKLHQHQLASSGCQEAAYWASASSLLGVPGHDGKHHQHQVAPSGCPITTISEHHQHYLPILASTFSISWPLLRVRSKKASIIIKSTY